MEFHLVSGRVSYIMMIIALSFLGISMFSVNMYYSTRSVGQVVKLAIYRM
jgi:predicted S18 family serine protease